MLNFDNLIIQTIDRITYKSKATGDIYFIAEDMQDATLSNNEEMIYGSGKAGRRISVLKRNKTASLAFTNGYVSMNQIATQTGDTVESSDTATLETQIYEVIKTVTGTPVAASTTYTAEGTAGSELLKIYKRNPDGSQGTAYTQAASVSATEFTYNPSTKALVLPTGVFTEVGTEIIVCYTAKFKGKKVANDGDTFSKDGTAIVDLTIQSVCDDTLYHGILVMDRASANGTFEIVMGGEQTVQAFSCEALPNICSGGDYWHLTVIDATT